jgi:hypothetical protein
MLMPWGKYKGYDIEDVPLSYLCWVLEEGSNVSALLMQSIREEVSSRLDIRPQVITVRSAQQEMPQQLMSMIEDWWRSALLKVHPDKPGGSVEATKQLNRIHDDLVELLLSIFGP